MRVPKIFDLASNLTPTAHSNQTRGSAHQHFQYQKGLIKSQLQSGILIMELIVLVTLVAMASGSNHGLGLFHPVQRNLMNPNWNPFAVGVAVGPVSVSVGQQQQYPMNFPQYPVQNSQYPFQVVPQVQQPQVQVPQQPIVPQVQQPHVQVPQQSIQQKQTE